MHVALEFPVPAPRAYWKGYLKLSFVSCPVALYPATSTAERISFRQVNRRTGHRLRHRLVDAVTGEAVDATNKARGYEVGADEFVLVEDRDLERARSARPPPGAGLGGVTLRFAHEVRGAEDYFGGIPQLKLPAEMTKLAQHIIRSKAAEFDPSMLEDHYRRALVGILRKKLPKRPAPAAPTK